MFKIPIDGFGQTGLKTVPWLPAKFPLGFGSIDRVAKIVAWPIGDEFNAIGMVATIPTRSSFVKKPTNRCREVYVADLVVSTNVVAGTGPAILANSEKCSDMVIYVKPIADVTALAINWNWLV